MQGVLALYQRVLSPLMTFLGARCRFFPTCSEYARQAIALHGPRRGVLRAVLRLLRCHPFCEGGVDLP